MQLSRKAFLKTGLVAVAVTAGIGELGCGDDDDGAAGAAGTSGAGGSTGGTGGSTGGTGGSTGGSGGSTGGSGGSTGGSGGSTGGSGGSTGGSGGSTGGSGGSTGGTGGTAGRGTGGTAGRGTGGTGNMPCENPEETIGNNHPAPADHTLMVPPGDVAAGTEKTYSIQGNSAHLHNITLTAEHFTTLQGGGMVTVASTVGAAHTHMVTVSCA